MVIASIAGPSNSGKTTFLVDLIPLLCNEGLRVGALKHCHHPLHNHSNSDSLRLQRAGAKPAIAITHNNFSLVRTHFEECDVLLVEGFRSAHFPTFMVYRGSIDPTWVRPINIIESLDLDKREYSMKRAFCYFVQKTDRT